MCDHLGSGYFVLCVITWKTGKGLTTAVFHKRKNLSVAWNVPGIQNPEFWVPGTTGLLQLLKIGC